MNPSRIAELWAGLMRELGYERFGAQGGDWGSAVNDSPVGLAAWIVEKFRTWSDCGGDVERVFTRDEMLTNVMIYWVSETATSSARLYDETRERPLSLSAANRVEVPVGVAVS